MPFEVQMLTSHATWKNACCYDEGDGDIRDEVFETHEDAQAALFELLADIAADAANGLSPPWSPWDFRIEYRAGTVGGAP
jgi:hypothetical protein